jgi:hypothetical protein
MMTGTATAVFYNALEFKTVRHGFVVECRLKPSYSEISTRLLVGDSELVRFDLQRFKSVRLIMDKNKELIRADFDRGHKQEAFALILKPYVWLGFGDLSSTCPLKRTAIGVAFCSRISMHLLTAEIGTERSTSAVQRFDPESEGRLTLAGWNREDRSCAGFSDAWMRTSPRALTAGVGKAPRHEIAGVGSPTVQRAMGN